MKTILRNGKYERVSNELADSLVAKNVASFAPKSEWKRTVRDVSKINSEERKNKKING